MEQVSFPRTAVIFRNTFTVGIHLKMDLVLFFTSAMSQCHKKPWEDYLYLSNTNHTSKSNNRINEYTLN